MRVRLSRCVHVVCLGCWLLVLAGASAWGQQDRPKPLTPEQQARLKERDRYAQEAERLIRQGKHGEAIAAFEKKLAIEREVYGNTHEEVAETLATLARVHEFLEDFAAARRARQEVLDIRGKLHGPKDWRVTDARLDLENVQTLSRLDGDARAQLRRADALNRQAFRLHREGKAREAVVLARQALEIQGQYLGREHRSYATSLNNLASLYQAMGDYGKALPLREQAHDLYKKLLTENHPDYATSLNNLASLYQAMGDYGKALPLREQARDLRKKLLTENHPQYATSLNNLAVLYKDMGDYGKALPLLEQARDLRKKLLTEDHPDYAQSLNNLASLYKAMGDYGKALPLLEQARDLRKKLLTENHPDYATSLNNLASLHKAMGDYGKALPLYEQARDLTKKFLTENHPAYATSLNNLASLYQAMGDYGKALPLYEQARDLTKKFLTENHPDYATSLNNLASLYQAMGDYGKALPLREQARDLRKKLLTENHPQYATSLNDLALLYKDMGDYGKALPLLEQARDLRKKLLTENHPDYANSLNNLAMLYQDMGDYGKALPLHEQARDLTKKLLTENHPHYATSLNNLAFLHYGKGDYPGAARTAEQVIEHYQRFLDQTFSTLNDRQRRDLLHQHHRSLTLYLNAAFQSKRSGALLYPHVLAWKGVLADRHAEERLAHDQPDLLPLLEQLRQARAGLAHLAYTLPTRADLQPAWKQRFDQLEADKEKLETRLALASQRYRQLRQAGVQELLQALPEHTALVDLLEYTHAIPVTDAKGRFRLETRLLAFVLRRDAEPVCVQLGASEPIDQAVQSWRQAVAQGHAPDSAGAALLRRVWQPLTPHLRDVQTVYIAPDGALCGLPFAALPGSKAGSYLIEELAIGYVTSGRHLLELAYETRRPASAGLLVLGDLVYGSPPVGQKPRYPDLPGTRLETERLAEGFRRAFPSAPAPRLLRGATADAAQLKQALQPTEQTPPPRYLHLATHGFFEKPRSLLQQQPLLRRRLAAWLTVLGTTEADAGRLGSSLALADRLEEVRPFELEKLERTYGRNPLLQAGLVLAQANRSAAKGILTAEEVASLDLRGLDLAVLSACETGLGKPEPGEGVLGLQQAFQGAGARTLVVSLWKVHDAATAVLMEEFYANLWQPDGKRSRLEALRQAQLTVLRDYGRVAKRQAELRAAGVRAPAEEAVQLPPDAKPGEAQRSPPALWAAFVLSGAAN